MYRVGNVFKVNCHLQQSYLDGFVRCSSCLYSSSRSWNIYEYLTRWIVQGYSKRRELVLKGNGNILFSHLKKLLKLYISNFFYRFVISCLVLEIFSREVIRCPPSWIIFWSQLTVVLVTSQQVVTTGRHNIVVVYWT
jgi:hypothetical protein